MSKSNGHEVSTKYLIFTRNALSVPRGSALYVAGLEADPQSRMLISTEAYSNDAVYLYSVYDDVQEDSVSRKTAFIPSSKDTETEIDDKELHDIDEAENADSLDNVVLQGEASRIDSDLSEDERDIARISRVPVVMPRRKFAGHCNIETVKDGKPYRYLCLSAYLWRIDVFPEK